MSPETQGTSAGSPGNNAQLSHPGAGSEKANEKSEVLAALQEARTLCEITGKTSGKRSRIQEGRLSAHDLVAIVHEAREWHTHAADIMAAAPVEEVAGFRAKAILQAFGSEPSASFTDETVKLASSLLRDEERTAARVKTLPPALSVFELMNTDFAPPQWIVPDLLTQGLTFLVGAPKLGKSWLALALGAAVGAGGGVLGRYRVERRRAVYLALEDTPRRLKSRLEKIGAAPDSSLEIFTQWRSGKEGIADLDAYLSHNPGIKLVIIDTFAKIRGIPQGDDRYASDYQSAGSLKAIADKHEIAVLALHHTRKMESDDPMDRVSGSNGLNGASDSTWILSRARGEADAQLFVTGRDVEEQTLALRFDSVCGSWSILGDAAEFTKSRERREVLDAVPLSPASAKTGAIAKTTEKKVAAVSRLLAKLEAEGLVFSPTYGEWSRRNKHSESAPALLFPCSQEGKEVEE